MKMSLELKKCQIKQSENLYVNWKGYKNSFNNWIYKKDIVI